MNAKRKIDPAPVFWGVCVALLILLTLWMPRCGHWITDGGNKAMVMENFLLHGTLAMENPASDLDPANRFFPDAVFHFQKTPKGIYSVFPPYFPILTAPFYHLAGVRGKYLIPLLGGAGALLLLLALLKKLHLHAPWLLPAALFATPLAFYSVEFWEMAPGICPVLGMMLLLLYRQDLPAGLVLACGLWLRPEMFFFALTTGAVLLPGEPRRALRFGAGFLAGALPYGLTQYLLFGHITGIHGETYANSSRRIFLNYYYYFFSCRKWALISGGAALLLGCAPRFRSLIRWKIGAGIAVAAGSIWFFRQTLLHEQPVFQTVMTVGLFTTTPFMYLLAANWRPLWNHLSERIRIIARISILYTLILPLFLTSTDWGIIWGARHWLFLFPLLATGAWFAARGKAMRLTAILLLLISCGFQIHGLQIQKIMRQNSGVLTGFLRDATGDVIVTDVFFLPMQTPELFRERRWLFVKNGRELLEAVALLREKNMSFDFVRSTDGHFRRIGNDALAELLKQVQIPRKPQKILLNKTRFLEVEVFRMEHR